MTIRDGYILAMRHCACEQCRLRLFQLEREHNQTFLDFYTGSHRKALSTVPKGARKL